jgi:hypothetical protein
MNKTKKILFILALLFSLSSIAQNTNNFCGTEIPENYFNIMDEKRDIIEKYEREYYQLKENRTSTAITNVPVKIHIVTQQGDRLDSLANQFYDDSSLWWIIATANNIHDSGFSVAPGTILRVPVDYLGITQNFNK